jgi:hypothetical protein
VRRLRLDRGLDRATTCVSGIRAYDGRAASERRARRGGLVGFDVECFDGFHDCRTRVRFVLTRPGTWRGQAIGRPRTIVVPTRSGAGRVSVRIPDDAPRGRRVVRAFFTRLSPVPGAANVRSRASAPVRIVRARR